MMHILFLCECNLNRSPFFEEYFHKNRPQYNVKSSGTSYSYKNKLDEEVLEWGDKVYVMDIGQHRTISRRFPDYLHKVEIIGIGDGEPNMLQLLEYWEKKEGL